LKEEKVRAAGIDKIINSKISKFYPIDKDEELEHDVETDELEDISDDEEDDDRTDVLMDDTKTISKQAAKNIQVQMGQMSEIYQRMTGSMESNLIAVQHYVRTL
jgi:hypothetical protein